jgi:hypothetical protein
MQNDWLLNRFIKSSLYFVFDLWAQSWRRTHGRGDVIVVRFADDFVVGCQHRFKAKRFLEEVKERF